MVEYLPRQISERLRARRIELGMSQVELAYKTGSSPATISALETGNYTHGITIQRAVRLAAALEIPPGELFAEILESRAKRRVKRNRKDEREHHD